MLEQHLGYEGARLQVAAALELEHVALRADHRAGLQAREQVAPGGRRRRRSAARPSPARGRLAPCPALALRFDSPCGSGWHAGSPGLIVGTSAGVTSF